MKVEEVPQDQLPAYQGHLRACYATDANGNSVKVESSGWHVEAVVNQQAIDQLTLELEAVRDEVLSGKKSPLAYAMVKRQMTPRLLAQHLDTCTWRVLLHLRPKHFERLPQIWRQRYARALAFEESELDHVHRR